MQINLQNPFYAYLFGFLQADGSLYKRADRNGTTSLKIEIKKSDEELLLKIKENLHVGSSILYRTRNTNFKDNYESVILTIGDNDFRNALMLSGLPVGKKSDIIKPPNSSYSACDYWRGIIDGDGSLGYTKSGRPFISLNSSSSLLVEEYKNYTEIITNRRLTTNKNKRDNTYNLIYYDEDAQFLVSNFYYPNSIYLERKYILAQKIIKWERTVEKLAPKKYWNDEQDKIVLTNSIYNAAIVLGRTENAIKTRLWRLKNNVI